MVLVLYTLPILLLSLLISTSASRIALFPGLRGQMRLRSPNWLKARMPHKDQDSARFTVKDLARLLSLKPGRGGLFRRTAHISSSVQSAIQRRSQTSSKTYSKSYGPDSFITTLVGWRNSSHTHELYILIISVVCVVLLHHMRCLNIAALRSAAVDVFAIFCALWILDFLRFRITHCIYLCSTLMMNHNFEPLNLLELETT